LNSIYLLKSSNYIDKVILKKRQEMLAIIDKFLEEDNLSDVTDIGTTLDSKHDHSNYIIKNLKNINIYKSISDQKITTNFFSKILNKSITENFSDQEISEYCSDLVISNATLEHVGNRINQKKMIENIIKLSKKKFVIITPNRYHPLDFHTQLPFLHWLPKKIHRKILYLIGLKFYSLEKNLNLLSFRDLKDFLGEFKNIKYNIFHIKFFGFKSNFIILGRIL